MYDTFELSDGSNFVSDIQCYFDYIFKKHKALFNNTLIQKYTKNKFKTTIEITITLFLQLLIPGTMKLLSKY